MSGSNDRSDESASTAPGRAGEDTAGKDYADRLERLQGARWKKVLDVQRPYRWNLQRLQLGRTLDIGCGVGRNLTTLGAGAVGVDHNADAIALCRERGLTAYTTAEWEAGAGSAERAGFDSLLLAHLMEHVMDDVGDQILRDYLPYLKPGGRVVFITPQEVGYRSDKTHVRFVGHGEIRGHADRLGLVVEKAYSFPFPRPVGKVFIYNEFITVTRLPA